MIKNLWGGVFALCLSMCLASCEGALDDILGEWSKPTPQVPSNVVEEAGVLGAALKTGAKVAITYTVGTKTYKATFTKNSDDSYTLDSNEDITPSATRAMTRSAEPTYVVPVGKGDFIGDRIKLRVAEKLNFFVLSSANVPLFKAELRISDGKTDVTNLNGVNIDCAIKGVDVNGAQINVQIPEKLSVKITVDMISYAVKFSEGDTWADVAESNKGNDMVKIAATTDDYISVNLSRDFVVSALKAAGKTQDDAETLYNSTYSDTFYLFIGSGTYVKATDEVGPEDSYTLRRIVDLSTVSGDTYNVTEDVIITGTPATTPFLIKYGGNYMVTLDNVNSEGSKMIALGAESSEANLTLKGTSKVYYIGSSSTVTIDEAEAGGTVILTHESYPLYGSTIIINGGTVKAKSIGSQNAVNGNLTVNGGAVYLAGSTSIKAVSGTITLGTGVSLYGWNGSEWGNYSNQQYATTDINAAPSTWTW